MKNLQARKMCPKCHKKGCRVYLAGGNRIFGWIYCHKCGINKETYILKP